MRVSSEFNVGAAYIRLKGFPIINLLKNLLVLLSKFFKDIGCLSGKYRHFLLKISYLEKLFSLNRKRLCNFSIAVFFLD